eukprot:6697829-Alexandrium_andersonii.AAC.1
MAAHVLDSTSEPISQLWAVTEAHWETFSMEATRRLATTRSGRSRNAAPHIPRHAQEPRAASSACEPRKNNADAESNPHRTSAEYRAEG